MDGSVIGPTPAHDQLGRFRAGNSEYRARQQRLAERVRQLNLDLDPSPSQRLLLPIIARHLDDALRARTAERRVRAGNAANRLLRSIPRKAKRPRRSRIVTMAEIEALERSHAKA
jgi:hypothetical protein